MAETNKKSDKTTKKTDGMAEEKGKQKVVSYLELQLGIKKEQLKYFEAPLDAETIKDIRKVEELILKNKIWMLEELISAIKHMK